MYSSSIGKVIQNIGILILLLQQGLCNRKGNEISHRLIINLIKYLVSLYPIDYL